MTRGLIRAADIARRGAELSEVRAGGRGERVRERLLNLLSKADLEALESMFAANAARALERMFRAEADAEATDPEALRLHECAACGATVPVCWEPPTG